MLDFHVFKKAYLSYSTNSEIGKEITKLSLKKIPILFHSCKYRHILIASLIILIMESNSFNDYGRKSETKLNYQAFFFLLKSEVFTKNSLIPPLREMCLWFSLADTY